MSTKKYLFYSVIIRYSLCLWYISFIKNIYLFVMTLRFQCPCCYVSNMWDVCVSECYAKRDSLRYHTTTYHCGATELPLEKKNEFTTISRTWTGPRKSRTVFPRATTSMAAEAAWCTLAPACAACAEPSEGKNGSPSGTPRNSPDDCSTDRWFYAR